MVGGPYFAFRLDTDQYNLIQSIASSNLPGIEFHFCAPTFASRREMSARYMARTVEANSVWIGVENAGQIVDDEAHTIVYSADGTQAFRFSEEAVPLKVIGDKQRSAGRETRQNDRLENVEQIYKTAFDVLESYWPKRRRARAVDGDNAFRLPKKLPSRKQPTVENTAKLLGQYFGTSLLVEVRE